MIDADDGSSLGETVALNNGEAQTRPECFGFAIERRAAGDEGPEFPTHLAMNAAEDPPTPQEMLAFGSGKRFTKFVQLP